MLMKRLKPDNCWHVLDTGNINLPFNRGDFNRGGFLTGGSAQLQVLLKYMARNSVCVKGSGSKRTLGVPCSRTLGDAIQLGPLLAILRCDEPICSEQSAHSSSTVSELQLQKHVTAARLTPFSITWTNVLAEWLSDGLQASCAASHAQYWVFSLQQHEHTEHFAFSFVLFVVPSDNYLCSCFCRLALPLGSHGARYLDPSPLNPPFTQWVMVMLVGEPEAAKPP